MPPPNPTAFFCHATEDGSVAREIAEGLMAAGIDTFYDEWSIPAGESILQRIDEGLAGCSHFIALLTEVSIDRAWVRLEIDAAFIRKLAGKTKFLPVRYRLSADRLSPTLATLHSPELGNIVEGTKSLVALIYGVSSKPTLGERPSFTMPPKARPTGLSIAASKLGEILVRRSELGRARDPELTVEVLLKGTELAIQDLQVGISDLKRLGLIEVHRGVGGGQLGLRSVTTTARIFELLDSSFMGWNPSEDAVRIAIEVCNSPTHWLDCRSACEKFGWRPRRMNPALTKLIRNKLVLPTRSIDRTFEASQISKTDETEAFIRRGS